MLTLIGLGLWNEEDVTVKGMRKAKKADKVYIELYTSKWHGDIKKIEKIINNKIKILKREDLEEKSDKILEEAKNKDVVIFVPGDPLIATTHISLLLNTKKMGIDVEVIHNASIYSAIGETGLHVYKFGATITIPFPEKTNEILPFSVYEKIKENKKKKLHTLLLLDVISEEKKYMNPNQGMGILLKTEEVMRQNIFTGDTEVVVFARAGSKESMIVYGKVKDLIKEDFGDPPFIIIIPGKLHFTEKEYLEYYRVDK